MPKKKRHKARAMEVKSLFTMQDLECLTELERNVVALREGLIDGRKHTFIEIAKKLGKKTKQDAQQAYKLAIRRLEAEGASRQLEVGSNEFKQAIEEIMRLYPTLGWIPNLAQRRIIEPWSKPPYPKMVVASCGNGVGKTNVIPQDIAGCLLGPEYLNDCWNRDPITGEPVGMINFQYYHDVKHLRDSGKFQYRILCGPEDMKEGGSLYVEIKNYIPTAKFEGKTSTGSFKSIVIPHPSIPGIKNTIDIKTFDQDTTTHAGANLHRIAINEPPPFPVFSETFARTRSKKSTGVEATVLLNATILDKATYIFDLENDDRFKGRIIFVQGAMWENCDGEEITDEIAENLFEKIGVKLQKNPNGKGYITYGQLTRSSIEDQIAIYDRTDPQQVDARVWGANVQLFGSEFKEFSTVHIIESKAEKIPKNVPVVQVVDPHPVKPDLCGYFYLDYMNKMRWFHDWPKTPWEKLKGRDKSIEQTCAEWSELEERLGISDQIVVRVGDPNRFKTSDSRDLMQLWCLYVPYGFSFNLFVSDNLEVGHQEIHSRLSYNKKLYLADPLDPRSWPDMTFTDNCQNLINSMKFYGRKAQKDPMAALTEQLDKKWKDGMDIIRYGCVFAKKKTIYELLEMKSDNGSDWEKIQQSRTISSSSSISKETIPAHKLKGSELISVGRY
jgi:hypothetical protein